MSALLACGAGVQGSNAGARTDRSVRRSAVAGVRAAAAATAASSAESRSRAPAMPELYVRCQDRDSCPSAVGMLVVANHGGSEPERCTVSLIGADRALTASHCLAPAERQAGATCAQTWIAFPQTAREPSEAVACARVLYASQRIDEGALQPEHAVLQLAWPLARAPLAVEATPAAPGSIVTVVSVTPHPVHGSTHALATRLCRAIDSQAAQDALGPAAAQVGWLASCPIDRGNSGSPVLDYEGRIRAIVHGGTSLTAAYGVTSDVTL